MEKYTKKLMIVFILLILIKIILSPFILTPTQFSDEYMNQRMAQSFYNEGKFIIDGEPSKHSPPLYPILISISFIFTNMKWIYFFIKIINSIISSTILFAGFLITKEFFEKEKAFKLSILLSLIPPMFGFFPFVLSENLFYPLFLFSIYFMYKSLSEKNLKWSILTGIFIGLCALTKVFLSSILVLVFILCLLIKLYKEKDLKNFFKQGLSSGFAFLVFFGWWLIRNFIVLENFVGNTSAKFESTFPPIIEIIKSLSLSLISNFSYLTLSTIIIFFIYSLLSYDKDGKYFYLYLITWLSVLTYAFLSSGYQLVQLVNQRLIGRYFAQVIPLIIITGVYGLKEGCIKIKNKFWIPFLMVLFVISGFKFIKERLFPVNYMSLSYLGVLDVFFGFLYSNYLLILFLALIPLSLILLKKIKLNRLITYCLIFFILINGLNFAIAVYNSNYRWYNLETTQIGLWFNDFNKDKNVLVVFDNKEQQIIAREYEDKYSDFKTAIERPFTTSAFWINSKVSRVHKDINNLEGVDYIISKNELNLTKIREGRTIHIYKT